jgi:hypothetical protein
MKPNGRVFNLSNLRLALATAGLLLVLLASLVWVGKLAHASSDPASTNANTALANYPSFVRQADINGLITPMPAADRADTNLFITDQGVSPILSDLFLIIFGVTGTILAVGPLALAAIMDIQSAHRP